MTAVTTALAGVIFGFALAAPPGPMNAIIAEESVTRSWSAGFSAGLGAMLADVLFFALTVAGAVAVIDRYPAVRPVLYLAGGLLMLYFAADIVQDLRNGTSFTDAGQTNATGFRKTFVLSLTNPYQIGFWLTVGVGLLQPGTLDVFTHIPAIGAGLENVLVVQTGSPLLLAGFFAGIAVWIVVYPAALVAVGHRIDAFAPAITLLSGVVLVGFGMVFLTIGVLSLV